MKKRTVLIFEDGGGDGPEAYLMTPTHAQRFFDYLKTNFERGENYKIRMEEWSQKQWKDAVELGRFNAGDMSKKQQEKFLAKLKKKNARKRKA